MLVKMKVSLSGSRDGKSWPLIGETLEVPDEEAVSLINARIVEPVEPVEAPIETAAAPNDARQAIVPGPKQQRNPRNQK